MPSPKNIKSLQYSHMFAENVNSKHGLPNDMVPDRRTQFTSRFWTQQRSHMTIDLRLSTTFHPQTYGLTQQQNLHMELYLRAISNYYQVNWAELLPLAEFMYNHSVYTSTKMTPFWCHVSSEPTDAVQNTESVTTEVEEPSGRCA